jgi:hypothetical protein
MSEKSSILILPALLSPIFMSIKTIGRVEGWVAAIVYGGSAHLAADHNTQWQALTKLGSDLQLPLHRYTSHFTYPGIDTR